MVIRIKLKNSYLAIGAILVVAAIVFLQFLASGNHLPAPDGSLQSPTQPDNTTYSAAPTQNSPPAGGVRVEVIHFHGTHQCYSCITVGDYAEETVSTYFSRELAEGRLSFMHINAELPENRELAAKYGVTSASLWIGVYDANGFHKEQNTQVWYKINDKAGYMSYLKGVIEKRLNGDLS